MATILAGFLHPTDRSKKHHDGISTLVQASTMISTISSSFRPLGILFVPDLVASIAQHHRAPPKIKTTIDHYGLVDAKNSADIAETIEAPVLPEVQQPPPLASAPQQPPPKHIPSMEVKRKNAPPKTHRRLESMLIEKFDKDGALK